MIKTTLLVAGLSAASITCAVAGTTKITFDNFCDGMQITTSDKIHYVSTQTGQCLQGVLVMGTGYKVGKKAAARVILGVNWEAFDGNPAGSEQYAYSLQYPFVTGGTWEEIITTDGQTFTVLNSGTYTVSHKDAEEERTGRPSFMPAR